MTVLSEATRPGSIQIRPKNLRDAIITGRANAIYHFKGHTDSILEVVKDTITDKLKPFLGDPETEGTARRILRAIIAEE